MTTHLFYQATMKTMFCLAALLALICSLQQALAETATSGDTGGVAETATSGDTGGVAETATSGVDGSEHHDPLRANEDDVAALIDGTEHHEPNTEDTHEEEKAAEIHDDMAVQDHDPDSEEYHAHMEGLSRTADAEDSKLEGKVPKDNPKEDADEAEQAAERAEIERRKKLDAEMEAPHLLESEDHAVNPKVAVNDTFAEEGMDVPTDEEEVILPTKYPEINTEMTHVSYVDEEKPDTVHVTLEYSFFKGADQYEICANCLIEKGVRVDAEKTGEVKSFSKDQLGFCEIGPACFTELIWKTGAHSFSLRAHTADKDWTIWSPNYNFQIESVVGMMTHVTHEEL